MVFTRADSKFYVREYISDEELPSGSVEVDSIKLEVLKERDQQGQESPEVQANESESTSAIYHFPVNDIHQRVMGVNNQCQSEYQKTKTREALVELIDVVQTANRGELFSHVYFNKANQMIVQRKEEEKQAREKFLEEELEQWREALRKAQKYSDKISDTYWKGVQRARFAIEQEKKYKNQIDDILTTLTDLKKGFSILKHMLEKTSCISLYSLRDCAQSQLNVLSNVNMNRTTAYSAYADAYGVPANTVHDNSDIIREVRGNFMKVADNLNTEIGQENAEFTQKIAEHESKEECKLAFIYATEAARGTAESHFKKMSLSDMQRESMAGFADTKKKIKEGLINHIALMEIVMTDRDLKIKESYVPERVTTLMTESLQQLQIDDSFIFSRVKWVGYHRKRDGQRKSKDSITAWIPAKSTTPKEANEREKVCLRQAVGFLTYRLLNKIRQQAIEEEYGKHAHCHQAILPGKTDKEIQKKYEKYFENIPQLPMAEEAPDLVESLKSQFAEVYVKKLLLEFEEDPDKFKQRKQELDNYLMAIGKERESYVTKLREMTDVLTNVVCRLAPDYAKSLNKDQLQEIKARDYNKAAKDLSQKVLKELSRGEGNKRLQNETKLYFTSGDKIGKAIKIYAKLNHDILMKLAKESKDVCFPTEAMVVEEGKGQMKICDVKVGDRLLATTQDGILIFEDVFMLGE